MKRGLAKPGGHHAASDPIELAIFQHAFHAVAEEMGVALRHTAFSPNIKERRDYSSAVFDGSGQVVAMGDDMPVHLGSMPLSVRAAVERLRLAEGDIAMLNDPYGGGTHLPDITLVMPVFFTPRRGRPDFFVANRAHHADVGGQYPGSMGLCREIVQEGLRIPPIKLVCGGELDQELLGLVLANTRTPEERRGDLTAQVGACRIGAERLARLAEAHGVERLRRNAGALLDYAERFTRGLLRGLPAGRFAADDALDDDGISPDPVRIAVAVVSNPRRRTIQFDFTGSSPQVAGGVNAVFAITYSAVYYVMRCLLPAEAPATAGLMRPVTIVAPERSVVHASPPAPVAGGNVETSQRIVDVILKAFATMLPGQVPAASAGSMSNVTVGGWDTRAERPFAYYETVAGGMGARPNGDGPSGMHTHMTNSLNTPVEAMEFAYPVRVTQYAYRGHSGGRGRFSGGDGLIREVEFLDSAQVTILSDRRRQPPYGLGGGEPGQPGLNLLIKGAETEELPGKCSLQVEPGWRLRIATPGGGGWGKA